MTKKIFNVNKGNYSTTCINSINKLVKGPSKKFMHCQKIGTDKFNKAMRILQRRAVEKGATITIQNFKASNPTVDANIAKCVVSLQNYANHTKQCGGEIYDRTLKALRIQPQVPLHRPTERVAQAVFQTNAFHVPNDRDMKKKLSDCERDKEKLERKIKILQNKNAEHLHANLSGEHQSLISNSKKKANSNILSIPSVKVNNLFTTDFINKQRNYEREKVPFENPKSPSSFKFNY
jgi:hypothetical protein